MAEKKSGLLDELRAAKQRTCPFRELFDGMDADLQRETIEALLDRKFSTASIAVALTGRGFPVGRHRLQECRDRCHCGLIPKEY